MHGVGAQPARFDSEISGIFSRWKTRGAPRCIASWYIAATCTSAIFGDASQRRAEQHLFHEAESVRKKLSSSSRAVPWPISHGLCGAKKRLEGARLTATLANVQSASCVSTQLPRP
jgi:hypothetical protein